MLTQAQADVAWITAGVLSPEEVASAHWGKGEYDPNLTVDFEAREAQESVAATPVDQDMINRQDPDHHQYIPPPEPGTADPSDRPIPPPGRPAAPDPNTRPQRYVAAEDSLDLIREDAMDPGAMVLAQLAPDFPDDALDWVRSAYWEGPEQVPLADLDLRNVGSWKATSEPDKVDKFAKRIKGGWMKPLVLVKRPSEDKLMIADGHHRALAYAKLGLPVMAYVAHVPTDQGPWDAFHDAQDERRDGARDERSRFAGAGYGMPSPAQAVARGGHERMTREHAGIVAMHCDKARELSKKASDHALAGQWDEFAEATRRASRHQALAAHAMSKVTYHAERAGTSGAREHAAAAVAAMSRRDEWSDAAREAALEARRQGASQQASKAAGHATHAKEMSAKAKKSGKTEDHRKAAQAHEQASRSFERAGKKYEGQAGEHEKAAGEHREHVPEPHKGPVASAPDREHGPVPPPKGHAEKPAAEGKAAKSKGGEKPHGKHGEGEHGKEHGHHGGGLKGALEVAKVGTTIAAGEQATEVSGLEKLGGHGGGEE
jgi:hypothetical protein